MNLWISEELIVVMFSCLTLLLAVARGFPVHCILSLHFDLLGFFLRWLSLSSCTVTGRMFSFMCFRILPRMIYMIVKWRSPYLSNFKEFYYQLAMIQELKWIPFIVFIFLQWKIKLFLCWGTFMYNVIYQKVSIDSTLKIVQCIKYTIHVHI